MSKFLAFICFLTFLTPSLMADTPSFVGNFNGFYLGPALGFGRTYVGVTNQRYKHTHWMAGGLLGYGHVFSSNVYFGGETGLFSDTFAHKKEGQKVEKSGQAEGVLRFGQLIQNNFLPYIGLGGAYSAYKMRSATQNQAFHTTDLISEVGVDAFVKPHITIRSSLRYQAGLGTKKKSSVVDVQKKPRSLFIKIGVSYIF